MLTIGLSLSLLISAQAPVGTAALETVVELEPDTATGEARALIGLTPLASLDLGDELFLEVGAPLRISAGAGAITPGGLELTDWDERSDYGQLIRHATVGREGAPFAARAGAASAVTLGFGHVVSAYSNRSEPDYHPASVGLTAAVAPLRVELFASDVLAARLFAAQLSAELGTDATRLTGTVAHDFGRSSRASPPVTLGSLELDQTLVRRSGVQAFGVAVIGAGSDALGARGVGGVGLSVDALTLSGWGLGARAEVLGALGTARTTTFGPLYEVERLLFEDEASGGGGATAGPRAELSAEAYVRGGPLTLWGLARGPGERGSQGSVGLTVNVLDGRWVAVAHAHAAGLWSQRSLVAARLELRGRLSQGIYALGGLGQAPFVTAAQELRHAWTASLGVGFDVATGETASPESP